MVITTWRENLREMARFQGKNERQKPKRLARKEWGGDLLAQIAENPKRHKTHKKHAKPSGGVPCGLCIKKQKGTKHTNSGIPFCVFCVFLCYRHTTGKPRRCWVSALFCVFCVFSGNKKGAQGPCRCCYGQTSRIVLRFVIPVSTIAIPRAISFSIVAPICLVPLPLKAALERRLFFACSMSLPCGNLSR